MSSLIYHKTESFSDKISPFDKTIRNICVGKNVLCACPYISVDYIEKILKVSKNWKIISDVEEWIKANPGNSRKRIVSFIQNNLNKIHHL